MEQLMFDFGAPVKLCECGCGEPAPIAKKTDSRLGHVKGQPVRYVCGHQVKRTLLIEVGQRFGRGVVIDVNVRIPCTDKRADKYTNRGARLICDCGNEYDALVQNLFHDHTRSCGCYLKDVLAARSLDPDWSSWARKPVVAGRNNALGGYKRQARSRGLAWELTGEDFDQLTSSDCYHCSTPPANVARRKKYEGSAFIYSGIDRLDNTLGYTRENSVPCCFDCNRYKLDLPYGEWQMIKVRNLSLTYFSRLSEGEKAQFIHDAVTPRI
jgi:hypothetical protein